MTRRHAHSGRRGASALPFVPREDVDESDATAQASAQDEAHDNFAASFDKRQ